MCSENACEVVPLNNRELEHTALFSTHPKKNIGLNRETLEDRLALRKISVITDSETYSGAKLFEKYFRTCIDCFGYDNKIVNEIKTAFGEAYMNATMHGNKFSDIGTFNERNYDIPKDIEQNKKKEIRATASICDFFVAFQIEDKGEGFDFSQEPKEPEKLDIDSILTHGRGRYLIKKCSDYHIYLSPGNTLLIIKEKIAKAIFY